MAAEVKKEIQLEVAHVLFLDIISYSKLPINEQRAALEKLNQIVRATDEFKAAEAASRLIKIPTGVRVYDSFPTVDLTPKGVKHDTKSAAPAQPTPAGATP